MTTKMKLEQRNLVEAWNASHPVGTRVRYWTSSRTGEGRIGETKSAAELLGGHTAVVWIKGVAGCLALSHVVAEPTAAEVSA